MVIIDIIIVIRVTVIKLSIVIIVLYSIQSENSLTKFFP